MLSRPSVLFRSIVGFIAHSLVRIGTAVSFRTSLLVLLYSVAKAGRSFLSRSIAGMWVLVVISFSANRICWSSVTFLLCMSFAILLAIEKVSRATLIIGMLFCSALMRTISQGAKFPVRIRQGVCHCRAASWRSVLSPPTMTADVFSWWRRKVIKLSTCMEPII